MYIMVIMIQSLDRPYKEVSLYCVIIEICQF